MKKFIIVFALVLCLAFTSCGAPSGGDYKGEGNGALGGAAPPGNGGWDEDDVAGDTGGDSLQWLYSAATTKGLNDLRAILPKTWNYAFVAGDCLFYDGGYFRLSDVLSVIFTNQGIPLGGESEREISFVRSSAEAYGIFRTAVNGGVGEYYYFKIKYDGSGFLYKKLGSFAVGDAACGSGGGGNYILAVVGDRLMAIDYYSGEIKKSETVGCLDDFMYYQKGLSALSFSGATTKIVTYIPQNNLFYTVDTGVDYSYCYDTDAFDGAYIFGGETPKAYCVYGSFADGEEAAVLNKYEQYKTARESGTVSDGETSATVNSDSVVVESNYGRREIALGEITALSEVNSALTHRRGQGQDVTPEITSVKISGGEIFIIIEKEPSTLSGVRDINDGLPPTVIKYDAERDVLTFVGMIDFTGYNVYRIIKL